jgi:preprotein translocase subunit SecA
MVMALLERVLGGSPNDRKIKALEPLVEEINAWEPAMAALSDTELQAKTGEFQQRLAGRATDPNPKVDHKLLQASLDDLLPEAFAVCREASKRVLGMRHYDVQLMGGAILHQGGIAEMRTGEGKTLVATLPVYLNALAGRGVHVVTVNDYLAKRDAQWMGQLYQFLGLSIGTVLSEQRGFDTFFAKKQAYGADITYGTNNEFGFDYLRDNMATSPEQVVQRPFFFAVVDEVDSILIDEARTPLIISGKVQQSAETYTTMARLAPLFAEETHYTVDEKQRNVVLTEEGIDKAQTLLGVEDLFDMDTHLAHHLLCALKAKVLYKKDTDYVVKHDEVVIVDEFTGRLMEGRRWSDGLHQALEAKEGVSIQDETQTLASITFQNLFRLYPKLAGMTGTAMTEAAEFDKIYSLQVTRMPTNRQDVRQDLADQIYKNERVKFLKVAESIVAYHQQGRPVLVGTTSIEKSEALSALLSEPQYLAAHWQEKGERFLVFLANIKAPEALQASAAQAVQAGVAAQAAPLAVWQAWREAARAEGLEALQQGTAGVEDWVESMAATAAALQQVRHGLPHSVLNAKQHEQEAAIIAQAGRFGAVTIATNMAGRGTDILLGGNAEFLVRQSLAQQGQEWQTLEEAEYAALVAAKKQETEAERQQVQALGGLHIIGTERHESRRIDNQLRGRAGRQGDPGSTQFYLSLEDSLMRLFGGQKIAGLMNLVNFEETLALSAGLVSKAIENAQHKVEAYHFDQRKNVLQYDDVLTEQRQLIYAQRKAVLQGENIRGSMQHMLRQCMVRTVAQHVTPEVELGDEAAMNELAALQEALGSLMPRLRPALAMEHLQGKSLDALQRYCQGQALAAYESLEDQLSQLSEQLRAQHGVSLSGEAADALGEQLEEGEHLAQGIATDTLAQRLHPLRGIERDMILKVVDARWIDYLHNLELLREGIGLRAYGQKDPVLEYKREAYELFQGLSYQIQQDAVRLLFNSQIQVEVKLPPEQMAAMAQAQADQLAAQGVSPQEALEGLSEAQAFEQFYGHLSPEQQADLMRQLQAATTADDASPTEAQTTSEEPREA